MTVKGKLIDLSCAQKGMVMMSSKYNAENDTHKTPKGDVAKCGTMCLKGGQPAGLFSDGKVKAHMFQAGLVIAFCLKGGDKEATDALMGVTKAVQKGGKVTPSVRNLEGVLIQRQAQLKAYFEKMLE